MNKTIKFIILICFLALVFILFRLTPLADYVTKESILAFLQGLREKWWGPALFIMIYAIGCLGALPGAFLTLAGGAVFGVWPGALYNLAAANLGANLAFFMSRFLGRDFVEGLLKGKKLAKFDQKINEAGFKTIFRLRLIPLVPFNGLNFGAGLSSVKFRDYFLGTLFGMIPGCFIYTYFADSLMSGIEGAGRKANLNLAIAALLLIALSFLPAIFKKVKS